MHQSKIVIFGTGSTIVSCTLRPKKFAVQANRRNHRTFRRSEKRSDNPAGRNKLELTVRLVLRERFFHPSELPFVKIRNDRVLNKLLLALP